jgi:hypothetical protein
MPDNQVDTQDVQEEQENQQKQMELRAYLAEEL